MTDAADLHLEIDYRHESAGWINCYLTFDGLTHKLWASDVFPPFIQLARFIRALAANRLPYYFYWDEEGHGALFEAWPVGEDSANFCFKVHFDRGDCTQIEAELDRQAVIEVILAALRDFALYAGPPSRGSWQLDLADVVALEEFRQRLIPPRSEVRLAEPTRFSLRRYQLDSPWQWLDLELWGIPLVAMSLPDSHPMWPRWFEFLEDILLGRFPAEVYSHNLTIESCHQEMVANGELPASELELPWGCTLRALAVENPSHFRLVVTETDGRYRDFLLIDEVQDRRRFVEDFCAEFERMLGEDYQVVAPDNDGMVFDLRTLPLERLKGLGKI